MKLLAPLIALMITAGSITPSFAADAPRPATIGGGIKHPWTSPYAIAFAPVPAASTVLSVLAAGTAALVLRRKKKPTKK